MTMEVAPQDQLMVMDLGLSCSAPWQEQCQYAVTVFSLDLIGIELDWDSDGPIKASGNSFAAVDARFLAVFDRLLARNSDPVALDLDIDVIALDTG